MYLKEIYIAYPKGDMEKGFRVRESGPYEASTDDVKRLFQSFQKKCGRCVSRVYTDKDGESKPTGWVFRKRMQYEGIDSKFILETRVILHEKPDEVIWKGILTIPNK